MSKQQRRWRGEGWAWAAGPLVVLVSAVWGAAAEKAPLKLVQTIQLKGPAGRLDHLALDRKHGRLFVANMANASLDVVDLKAGKLIKQVPGQKGIQGIAYAADLDRIFVGNGTGGACNVFDGRDYKLLKSIPLADADNVRYQRRTRRVYVAHAEKALAVIDAKTLKVLTDIKLPGAPEAFQLEAKRPRLYLNTPSVPAVVVIATDKNKVVGRYPLRKAGGNFPLALDAAGRRLFIGCRRKPLVVVLDTDSGKEVARMAIPGDVDDLFFDAKRKRIYASCGEGFLAVLQQTGKDLFRLAKKIPTAKVARTSLFDAQTGRLYLVMPRQPKTQGPEIRVYRAQ
jgi:DNA-binding beta-propeller fold protein YncE